MIPIRLSICIATLNRANLLREALDSIVTQITDEVEIVIVDGASTDHTAQVVCDFQSRYSQITYLRLDQKGGVDQDYSRTIELARGEYCWFMSDDDQLMPGAVKRVLDATCGNYSLIIVNSTVWNSDFSAMLQVKALSLEADQVYPPSKFDQLFADTASYLTFIGAVVIRRDLWDARDRSSYFGGEFVHVGVIFQKPLPSHTLIVANPCVRIRYGNAQWSNRTFQIWLFKWPALAWSFPQIARWAKQRVIAKDPWSSPLPLLDHRALGTYSLNEYKTWIAPRLGWGWRKGLAYVIAQLPGCLVNRLAILYYTRIKSSRPLRLFDLQNSRVNYWHCGSLESRSPR